MEAKMSEMDEVEKGAIGREGAIEAAATEVKPSDMTSLLIAADTIPQTAIPVISSP